MGGEKCQNSGVQFVIWRCVVSSGVFLPPTVVNRYYVALQWNQNFGVKSTGLNIILIYNNSSTINHQKSVTNNNDYLLVY